VEHKKGFEAEVQQIGPHIYVVHCIVDRKALVSRDYETKLYFVLQEAVKILEFVKACPLKSRLFAVLYEEMQADRNPLLYTRIRFDFQGVDFLNV
jgi:hypothetical protein